MIELENTQDVKDYIVESINEGILILNTLTSADYRAWLNEVRESADDSLYHIIVEKVNDFASQNLYAVSVDIDDQLNVTVEASV